MRKAENMVKRIISANRYRLRNIEGGIMEVVERVDKNVHSMRYAPCTMR
jgi:hypothetical protein